MRRLRAPIVPWWQTVGPAVAVMERACHAGDRATVVTAARAALVVIGATAVPDGEERCVAEWFGLCALVADTWRSGTPDECGDVHRLIGLAVDGLYDH